MLDIPWNSVECLGCWQSFQTTASMYTYPCLQKKLYLFAFCLHSGLRHPAANPGKFNAFCLNWFQWLFMWIDTKFVNFTCTVIDFSGFAALVVKVANFSIVLFKLGMQLCELQLDVETKLLLMLLPCSKALKFISFCLYIPPFSLKNQDALGGVQYSKKRKERKMNCKVQ